MHSHMLKNWFKKYIRLNILCSLAFITIQTYKNNHLKLSNKTNKLEEFARSHISECLIPIARKFDFQHNLKHLIEC